MSNHLCHLTCNKTSWCPRIMIRSYINMHWCQWSLTFEPRILLYFYLVQFIEGYILYFLCCITTVPFPIHLHVLLSSIKLSDCSKTIHLQDFKHSWAYSYKLSTPLAQPAALWELLYEHRWTRLLCGKWCVCILWLSRKIRWYPFLQRTFISICPCELYSDEYSVAQFI